jgi:hypothetical protein
MPEILDPTLSTIKGHRSAILLKARQHGFADDNLDRLLLDAARRLG